MAFLMLFSSTGLAIDFHYCKGSVKSFSVFGKAKTCQAMAMSAHCGKTTKACHSTPDSKIDSSECSKDCCTHKTILLSGDDHPQQNQIDLVVEFEQTQVIHNEIHILDQSNLAQNYIAFTQYKPPILENNFPVLFQSFLL